MHEDTANLAGRAEIGGWIAESVNDALPALVDATSLRVGKTR